MNLMLYGREGDTIAAVATPWGEGGIGVVRLSGPDSLRIAGKVFFPVGGESVDGAPSHVLLYGRVCDPRTEEVIDEGILLVMRAPRSYTREDVAEVQCHGGRVAVAKVLGAVIAAGARGAEPGEFTRRAFLNGRIDLTQAEAVLEVVRASSESEHRASVAALSGFVGERVRQLSRRVWDVLVRTEGSLNYPEEVEPPPVAALVALAEEAGRLTTQAERTPERMGFRIVLIGPPNAGKSSLLNTLLGYPRAIVSPHAGTTRDTVEAGFRVGDLDLVLVDTAGVRETADEVERLGVERSLEAISGADLVLVVLDASQPLGGQERRLFSLLQGRELLVILNKVDLGTFRDCRREVEAETGRRAVEVSALRGEGMASLEALLLAAAGEHEKEAPGVLVSQRQRGCLSRAAAALDQLALGAGRGEIPAELWPFELRKALEALGEVTGENVSPDLLEEIFSRFCLGK